MSKLPVRVQFEDRRLISDKHLQQRPEVDAMFFEDSTENRAPSRMAGNRAKQLKRRSIRTLNPMNTLQKNSKIPAAGGTGKVKAIQSSGYGRPGASTVKNSNAAPRFGSRPATAPNPRPVYRRPGSRGSASSETSFGGHAKRGIANPAGQSVQIKRRKPNERVSGCDGDGAVMKERLEVLEERIVRVEMNGAAVPARAASHHTQEAYENLLNQLQNAQNTIQQKEHELAQKEAQIGSLEAQCSANTMIISQKTITIEQMKAHSAAQEAKLSTQQNQLEANNGVIEVQATTIDNLLRENERKTEQLKHYEMKQRELHEIIQDLKGSIRVYCRVRPFLPYEAGKIDHLGFPDQDEDRKMVTVHTFPGAPANIAKAAGKWKLDRVFGPHTNQTDLFEELSELVQSALHGYNVSVFAYGQTGSGKTYTMEGGPDPEIATFTPDSEGAGIIPRAVMLLFRSRDELVKLGWRYTFKLSFLEIYNEELRDLMASTGRETDIRGRKGGKLEVSLSGKEVTVSGLTITEVKSPFEVLGLVSEGLKRRVVGATKCNERSSRSHALFQLHISSTVSSGRVSESLLNLVDLAGSERLKESESSGSRLTEAQHINSSLSTLKMVIRNQAQKNGKGKGHVPYRNSKLSMLLKNSLGGGSSKTLMLTTVSPTLENAEETKRTLDFALEASQCYIGVAALHAAPSRNK